MGFCKDQSEFPLGGEMGPSPLHIFVPARSTIARIKIHTNKLTSREKKHCLSQQIIRYQEYRCFIRTVFTYICGFSGDENESSVPSQPASLAQSHHAA